MVLREIVVKHHRQLTINKCMRSSKEPLYKLVLTEIYTFVNWIHFNILQKNTFMNLLLDPSSSEMLI